MDPPPPPPVRTQPAHFFGSVELDPMTVGSQARKVAEEVICHLNSLVDANVRVTLNIEVELPSGIGDDVKRTVQENAHTLKFTFAEF